MSRRVRVYIPLAVDDTYKERLLRDVLGPARLELPPKDPEALRRSELLESG